MFPYITSLVLVICQIQFRIQVEGSSSSERLDGPSSNEGSEETNNLSSQREVANSQVLAYHGNQLCQQNEYKEALERFAEAIEMNPDEPSHYRDRGKCYLRMGNFDAAILDLKKLLQLCAGTSQDTQDEDTEDDRILLIRTLVESGRIDEAVNEMRSLSDESDLMRLAEEMVSEGKFEQALLYYNEMIRADPNAEYYYWLRGMCYWKMGRSEDAIANLKKSLQIDSDPCTMNVIEFAEILLEAGRYEEAANVLEILDGEYVHENEGVDRLEKARQKIREIEMERFKNFVVYLNKLITENSTRQTDKIKQQIGSGTNNGDDDLQMKIQKLEQERNNHLEELERSFAKFQVDEAPIYFIDPIGLDQMRVPVTSTSGITYEREKILKHLMNNKTDPMTRKQLLKDQLIPNRALKEGIRAWRTVE